jgi:hypothetical protein
MYRNVKTMPIDHLFYMMNWYEHMARNDIKRNIRKLKNVIKPPFTNLTQEVIKTSTFLSLQMLTRGKGKYKFEMAFKNGLLISLLTCAYYLGIHNIL